MAAQHRVQVYLDRWWTIGLFVAALVLFCLGLDHLPLRDWDEGIVAQVARNMLRSPENSLGWLYPTLSDRPYLNKPPLIHWLIALTYHVTGITEWSTRLLPAALSACAVPLLYQVGREIFCQRTPAVFASLIYLTLLPAVRHGRLAMLDGSVVCFYLLALLCLLRGRRDIRYSLGFGLGIGLICLTKSLLGILLGAIALIFLAWDTPRLFKSFYLWIGLSLGIFPFLLWLFAQSQHYGFTFLNTSLNEQALSRLWQPVENRGGPPWYYLLELLKYTAPWLIFLPQGLQLVWKHRTLSWAKLILIWGGIYLSLITLMSTKLPWYIIPLYPTVALIGGVALTDLWRREWTLTRLNPNLQYLPKLFSVLAIAAIVAFIYLILQANKDFSLLLAIAVLALTLILTQFLILQGDRQFFFILFWGNYVALLLFFNSQAWIWELNESYPVKPIAQIINQSIPQQQPVFTSYPAVRPSLDFYSDRPVIPLSLPQLQQTWQYHPNPYFLLDQTSLKQLSPLPRLKVIKTTPDWTLIERQSQPNVQLK